MSTIPHPHVSDSDIDANGRLIAAATLAHPLAILLLTPGTASALASIAYDEPELDPAAARRLLRGVIAAIDAAEITMSMGVAA